MLFISCYFIFVLKIDFFCLDILIMQLKQRDYEDKVNFKMYDMTTLLTITIHILPNISRSKGN